MPSDKTVLEMKDGEPVEPQPIVLNAGDPAAAAALSAYAVRAEHLGFPSWFIDEIKLRVSQFETWRKIKGDALPFQEGL